MRLMFTHFLREHNSDNDSHTNLYTDAFGFKRDLYKAHVFVTKSMFKAYSWLKQYCEAAKKEGKTIDPMEFYCNALKNTTMHYIFRVLIYLMDSQNIRI